MCFLQQTSECIFRASPFLGGSCFSIGRTWKTTGVWRKRVFPETTGPWPSFARFHVGVFRALNHERHKTILARDEEAGVFSMCDKWLCFFRFLLGFVTLSWYHHGHVDGTGRCLVFGLVFQRALLHALRPADANPGFSCWTGDPVHDGAGPDRATPVEEQRGRAQLSLKFRSSTVELSGRAQGFPWGFEQRPKGSTWFNLTLPWFGVLGVVSSLDFWPNSHILIHEQQQDLGSMFMRRMWCSTLILFFC